jgi:hypothetical protein
MRVIPSGRKGMTAKAGIAAKITRVSGMSASPTIRVRDMAMMPCTAVTDVMITEFSFCWKQFMISTLRLMGMLRKVLQVLREGGNNREVCASMTYARR